MKTFDRDEIRRRLKAGLSVSGQLQRQRDFIFRTVEQRAADVQHRLDELRPKALTDGSAGDEYQRMLIEQGQLNNILSLDRYRPPS